jgi:Zn-finger nucleic acid-binding protein
MIVSAIQCPNCKATVFSRARHDMRWCPCGAVAIDGGRDYSKISFNGDKQPEFFQLVVACDNLDLVRDWRSRADEFGVIPAPLPDAS